MVIDSYSNPIRYLAQPPNLERNQSRKTRNPTYDIWSITDADPDRHRRIGEIHHQLVGSDPRRGAGQKCFPVVRLEWDFSVFRVIWNSDVSMSEAVGERFFLLEGIVLQIPSRS